MDFTWKNSPNFTYKRNNFSSLCLSPQLFPEHIHQSVGERELQHITCVCADILLRRPGCDLPALPGPDLCGHWIVYLCACEYILKTRDNLTASTESKITNPALTEALSCLNNQNLCVCSCRTVYKEQVGLQTQLEHLSVLLGLYGSQKKASAFTQNNNIYLSLFCCKITISLVKF